MSKNVTCAGERIPYPKDMGKRTPRTAEAVALGKEMGTRLRRLREAREINAKVAADDLRIGYHALNKYELGKRVPDLDDLIRLADYYRVSLDFLIAGRQHEKQAKTLPPKLRQMSA